MTRRFPLPDGLRVYAIGDIHGHPELLDALQAEIARDLAAHPHDNVTEVYIGDYVDRGPDPAGVVERLTRPPPAGRERICLEGNHEDMLLRFLEDETMLGPWIDNGGLTTLASYGVDLGVGFFGAVDPAACREAFAAALPPHHRAFFDGLQLSHRLGDVLFVHAGIRPEVPLEEQDPFDLLWIRGEFLNWPGPLPVRVVHGHTPVARPQVTPWRIGIDTGAFATGRLTAAVLEGAEVRFLST